MITFVVTHRTPRDIAKNAPSQLKMLCLYMNVCVHDTNQNRRWALHTRPASSRAAPVAEFPLENTCFIWCGGLHIRGMVKGRHGGEKSPVGTMSLAENSGERLTPFLLPHPHPSCESFQAVISKSGLSHQTVVATWTRNKRPLRRDLVARVGVHEGRDGMSHLELIDMSKSFQEDHREAREREGKGES